MGIHDEFNTYKYDKWSNREDFDEAKKKILQILRGYGVSLSETRYLFHDMLYDIETQNKITL